jgi:hypothetical protein
MHGAKAGTGSEMLLDFIQLDPQFFELGRVNRRGRIGERALGFLRFGKGNHFTNGIGIAKEHDEPVQAERDAAVRRRAELKGFEEKSELGPGLILVDTQQIQNP